MRGTPQGVRRSRAALAALLLVAPLAACSAAPAPDDERAPAANGTDATSTESLDPRVTAMNAHAVAAPGPLDDPLVGADMLIVAQEGLGEETLEAIGAVEGIEAVEPIGLSQIPVQDRVLWVASVDPATYRRFTPAESAQSQEVWTRVAGGEVALAAGVAEEVQDDEGYLPLGNETDAAHVHVGAYAAQVTRIDAVVNKRWGETLGAPGDNAALIATGATAPQEVRAALQEAVGDTVSVQVLGPDLDISVQQTAVLTGGSVAAAVGTFNYHVLDGGRIAPDPAWVAANIRTQQVPILGDVTCHRVMLPQLEAALREITERGLAETIDPDQYAGCYYPRFIANSTSLSLHSFGIALDINTPGNQRGTVGEIDRTVVAIFKKWGFAWGGDWSWTDPMHFELAQLVDVQ